MHYQIYQNIYLSKLIFIYFLLIVLNSIHTKESGDRIPNVAVLYNKENKCTIIMKVNKTLIEERKKLTKIS